MFRRSRSSDSPQCERCKKNLGKVRSVIVAIAREDQIGVALPFEYIYVFTPTARLDNAGRDTRVAIRKNEWKS